MRWLWILLAAASWIINVRLGRRLTQERLHKNEVPPLFGLPYTGFPEMLDRRNYTEAGGRLLPWFALSGVTMAIGVVALFFDLFSNP